MRLLVLLISLLVSDFVYPQQRGKHVNIKTSSEWITKLRTAKSRLEYAEILNGFEALIKPDSLYWTKSVPHLDNAILNTIFVDLDGDNEGEIIGLFGWSEHNPMLVVFKKIKDSWYLKYTESFYMFYTSPELYVANNYSPNKVFYIRCLTERGSGVYSDEYHLYKILNGKVHLCLNLLNEARIYGWGLNLNQNTKSKFKINSSDADELWVSYEFKFFAGPIIENDQSWDSHDGDPFVNKIFSLLYKWDSTKLEYIPEYGHYPAKDDLNPKKLSCFRKFGNDTLFVSAFEYEIKQTLQKGSSKQKELLNSYLNKVNLKGKVR